MLRLCRAQALGSSISQAAKILANMVCEPTRANHRSSWQRGERRGVEDARRRGVTPGRGATRASIQRASRRMLQMGSAPCSAPLRPVAAARGPDVLRSGTETVKQGDLRAGVYYRGSCRKSRRFLTARGGRPRPRSPSTARRCEGAVSVYGWACAAVCKDAVCAARM